MLLTKLFTGFGLGPRTASGRSERRYLQKLKYKLVRAVGCSSFGKIYKLYKGWFDQLVDDMVVNPHWMRMGECVMLSKDTQSVIGLKSNWRKFLSQFHNDKPEKPFKRWRNLTCWSHFCGMILFWLEFLHRSMNPWVFVVWLVNAWPSSCSSFPPLSFSQGHMPSFCSSLSYC